MSEHLAGALPELLLEVRETLWIIAEATEKRSKLIGSALFKQQFFIANHFCDGARF